MNRRLLAIQGPLQYITGRIAFTWKQPMEGPSKDTLLLYDFLCDSNVEDQIAETVRLLANLSIWKRIVHIRGHEMNALMQRRYANSKKGLRELVGEEEFDEIYLARDHVGNGSALLMNAYPQAKKYSYGDSFGMVGQKDAMKRLEGPKPILAHLRSFARRLLLGGPLPLAFDEAVLSLPVDMSGTYLKTVKLAVPSRAHVLNEVSKLYVGLPDLDRYCDELMAMAPAGQCHLYLLSNLAGSGLTTTAQEENLYAEIIRAHSSKVKTVFIKPHPRSGFQLLDSLSQQLRSTHQIVILDDVSFARLPIELWSGLLSRCQVVAMFSTSSINMKYLYGKEIVIPLDTARILQYINELSMDHVSSTCRMMKDSMQNLDTWDGRSVLWSAE